ncbi:CU044_2847 family protein [Actinomadura nitritigenes]|uniref:CU044_2847 family protein n=1 Tax=Actinomadura nitritigenes TaxID=134602 RepID=UPI003D8B6EAF
MDELLRWQTDSGSIVVEGDQEQIGYASVAKRPGDIAYEVSGKLEEALKAFRDSAASALTVFRDDVLRPDEVEVEFGLKLNAEVGAVLAKASAEGSLVVKLRWARSGGEEQAS